MDINNIKDGKVLKVKKINDGSNKVDVKQRGKSKN